MHKVLRKILWLGDPPVPITREKFVSDEEMYAEFKRVPKADFSDEPAPRLNAPRADFDPQHVWDLEASHRETRENSRKKTKPTGDTQPA